ncbi:hypothetical protein EBB07_29365 [Paenibacillaceae bacterium]|nr:hypothetical protein EBB07_29365 [Paenibacillaceae bacterium]
MKKKIIIISENINQLSGAVVFKIDAIKNVIIPSSSIVLLDRHNISTSQIIYLKKAGINFTTVSPAYDEYWLENASLAWESILIEKKIQYIISIPVVSETVMKLLRLAKCPSASYGEKRNAVNAAFKLLI